MSTPITTIKTSETNLKLRVLSGLNVGETIELSDGPILVGGSDDCDLFLVDPHVDGEACIVEHTHAGISLTALKGSSNQIMIEREKNQENVTDTILIQAGTNVSVNGILFTVECGLATQKSSVASAKLSLLDQKRQALEAIKQRQASRQKALSKASLAESSRVKRSKAVKTVSSVSDNQPLIDWSGIVKKLSGSFSQTQNSVKGFVTERLNRNRNAQPTTTNIQSGTPEAGAKVKSTQYLWMKPASVITTSLAISLWMISAARGIASPEQTSPHFGHLIAQQSAPMHDEVLMINSLPATGAGEPLTGHENPSKSGLKGAYLQHLQSVFKKMLIARELPVSVTLSQEGHGLVVKGILPASQQKVLQRMLVRFQLEQGIELEINNQVTPEKHALPFEIVQVTSGRYGNIVTDSGNRLFVGDQLAGYQLVAIQSHHVIFSGKSRVTVEW